MRVIGWEHDTLKLSDITPPLSVCSSRKPQPVIRFSSRSSRSSNLSQPPSDLLRPELVRRLKGELISLLRLIGNEEEDYSRLSLEIINTCTTAEKTACSVEPGPQ